MEYLKYFLGTWSGHEEQSQRLNWFVQLVSQIPVEYWKYTRKHLRGVEKHLSCTGRGVIYQEHFLNFEKITYSEWQFQWFLE